MRKIESIEDEIRGTVTYDLENGRYFRVDARHLREYGLAAILKAHGIDLPQGRLPVFQDGREIGSVPSLFEPMSIKSKSFLYDVRPGDFKRTNKGWEASPSLGPGDLHAVPGFAWSDHDRHREMDRVAEEERHILMSAITGKDLAK